MFFPELELKGGSKDKKGLHGKFVIPPFSVLDAKQHYWMKRKRAWIALGIRGEKGRGEDILFDDINITTENLDYYRKKNKRDGALQAYKQPGGDALYTTQKWKNSTSSLANYTERYHLGRISGFSGKRISEVAKTGASVFDPVLCELMYRWFCPGKGYILDPFAGESTKGVVASYLDYHYTGIEIRPEQVEENNAQAKKIKVYPTWIQGDSHQLNKLIPKEKTFDFIFTSPPYYDLEIYSESKQDGSTLQTYEEFMEWYFEIFEQAVSHLKDNCFLAIKIGEIRDKKTGVYRNFIGDNVHCFSKRLNLHYYNEIILVTSIGSLPIRVGIQFNSTRKIGKTHQNILVFYKGDLKKIKRLYE